MPASSISRFSDPGAFQEALGSAQVEVMMVAQSGVRSFGTDFEGQALTPFLPPNATAFCLTLLPNRHSARGAGRPSSGLF
jgi:hypothetical protein